MPDPIVEPAAAAAPAAPAAVTAPVPAAPAAPAEPAAPAAPAGNVFTQDELNAIVQERVTRAVAAATKTGEKTAEDRIAELEAKSAAADAAGVTAHVLRAAAGAHNPDVIAKLVDLEGLTASDGDVIVAKVTEFLTENPYLVKDGAPAPAFTTAPAPGVTSTGSVKLLSAAEMDAISVAELASDPAKMALYLESKAALV